MAELKQKVFDQLNPICRDMSQGTGLSFQCKATIEQAIKDGEISQSDILTDQFKFETRVLEKKFHYCAGDHLTIQEIMEIAFWIAVYSYIEEWMNLPTENTHP